MDKLNTRKIKEADWFSLGMSIVCFAIYIFRAAAGRDPSPALILVGIATGLGAATILAGAKKLREKILELSSDPKHVPRPCSGGGRVRHSVRAFVGMARSLELCSCVGGVHGTAFSAWRRGKL